MGGKGRLTQGLIKKLTNYYGWAIKSHPNDVPGMERATYYHVTSTDQEPHHDLCPSGTDSWCLHNRALAKGEPLPPHKHKLPPHPAELQENARNAEAKLQELASTSATKRKQDRLAAAGDGAAADSPDNVSFVVVSLDSVNDLLRCVKCKTCGGDVNISKCDREYGLAVKLLITCVNCGDISSAWSSPRVAGDQNINPFSVNILAARAMQGTGNRQTALNDIFSAMNISHRGLHIEDVAKLRKKKIGRLQWPVLPRS
ncbi:hypothetical protein HPB48_017426 [Haemaphysalis longicornis]|uniref:Mutator-like transposase domain-containing protein n=1 Tax=Haemaphysalis longicornis TaxID=44386 RepID=A0A9J6G9S2_HAELO|nr:hypothetical protein HPB48_017426 [Haemaphysalis longicornis]